VNWSHGFTITKDKCEYDQGADEERVGPPRPQGYYDPIGPNESHFIRTASELCREINDLILAVCRREWDNMHKHYQKAQELVMVCSKLVKLEKTNGLFLFFHPPKGAKDYMHVLWVHDKEENILPVLADIEKQLHIITPALLNSLRSQSTASLKAPLKVTDRDLGALLVQLRTGT
jgi:hypothetical protein